MLRLSIGRVLATRVKCHQCLQLLQAWLFYEKVDAKHTCNYPWSNDPHWTQASHLPTEFDKPDEKNNPIHTYTVDLETFNMAKNARSLAPPQWVIDLNSAPQRPSKTANIPDPPGYPSSKAGSKQVRNHCLADISRQRERDTTVLTNDVSSNGPHSSNRVKQHPLRPARPPKPMRLSWKRPGRLHWPPRNNSPWTL
jgi:hypothetical protein